VQNNGDNNVMAGATTVVAAPGGLLGRAATAAEVTATIADSRGPGPIEARSENSVSAGAFAGVKGAVLAQQNNGSNNAIQSAVAVTARY
jgi:hypothetical protein